jgi:hypothetical protein
MSSQPGTLALQYGEIARRELNAVGFSVRYDPIRIDASADEVWQGVANRCAFEA